MITGPIEATVMDNLLVQVRTGGELEYLAEMREVIRASSEMQRFEPVQDSAWDEAAARFAKLSAS